MNYRLSVLLILGMALTSSAQWRFRAGITNEVSAGIKLTARTIDGTNLIDILVIEDNRLKTTAPLGVITTNCGGILQIDFHDVTKETLDETGGVRVIYAKHWSIFVDESLSYREKAETQR